MCKSPNLVDNCFQVHLQLRLITTSNRISNLAQLMPLWLHNHALHVHLHICSITAFKCISPSSLDDQLHVYLRICSSSTSKWISKLARSWPRSVSLSSIDHDFQTHHELLSSTACTWSRYTVSSRVAI
jgi:hypothetical protein